MWVICTCRACGLVFVIKFILNRQEMSEYTETQLIQCPRCGEYHTTKQPFIEDSHKFFQTGEIIPMIEETIVEE